MPLYLLRYDPVQGRKVWVDVGDPAKVTEGVIHARKIFDRTVVLTRVDGAVCAVDGQCPHRETSLAGGRIDNGTIRCPMHGYEYDMRTGKGMGNNLQLETIRCVESEEPPR